MVLPSHLCRNFYSNVKKLMKAVPLSLMSFFGLGQHCFFVTVIPRV